MSIDKAIDPGRLGLSKSLMTSPCERKGFYSETVRDSQGRRLSFPMPERVLFGSALDSAILYIAEQLQDEQPWTFEQSIREGMTAAQGHSGWPLVEDKKVFEIQLANALELFIGRDAENGIDRLTARIAFGGLRMQGDNGKSLRTEDIVGTPDFMDDGVIDLKTSGKKYSESRFWTSPEMPVYTWLYAAENGVLPRYLAYWVYVRVTKPYWQWLEINADAYDFGHLIDLGRLHAARWRKGLEHNDPDLFSFDASFCKDCPFRQPIPEVGFEGCAVGALVPVVEDIAA